MDKKVLAMMMMVFAGAAHAEKVPTHRTFHPAVSVYQPRQACSAVNQGSWFMIRIPAVK